MTDLIKKDYFDKTKIFQTIISSKEDWKKLGIAGTVVTFDNEKIEKMISRTFPSLPSTTRSNLSFKFAQALSERGVMIGGKKS
jgi:hypothetical protein